ncbi:hypothetical protein LV779_25315 [Streptomyces thinghirensis]|nr:hypothetical protein [Streptomyces thinghirensis]
MTTSGTTGTPAKPQHPWGNRGRHRRPRPRKAVLTAGGLALAAGALSLVRLLPGPGGGDVDGYGAEAGPRVETGGGQGTAPDPATTPAAASTAGPPGAEPVGDFGHGRSERHPGTGSHTGAGAVRERPLGRALPPRRPSRTPPDTDGKAPPPAHTPRPPRPPESSLPPRPDTPAPRPAPTPPPDRGTPPAPTPEPGPPGLCVPVVGLCVDLLDGDG